MSSIEPFAGEPHKDRFLAALRGERTDRVPHFEILIEDQHVEKLLGRPAGNTLGVGGDPAKGAAAAEGTRPMYPRDYIELCRAIGQDVIAWRPSGRPLNTFGRMEAWDPSPTEASRLAPTLAAWSGRAKRT